MPGTARTARRRRNLVQAGLGLGILAILTVIVLVVTVNAGSGSTTSDTAGPKNMVTNGLQFTAVDGRVTPVSTADVPASGTPEPVASAGTAGAAKVVMYIDWACPACKQFEAALSAPILKLVAEGKATLEVHPIAILDRSYQSSRYSSRAANAAACVADLDPKAFLAVQNAFYAEQPHEGTAGLTNAQIVRLVREGSVTDRRVTRCVDSERFGSWVTAATQRAVSDPALVNPSVNGFSTPTVLVDGARWNGSSDLLALIVRDDR